MAMSLENLNGLLEFFYATVHDIPDSAVIRRFVGTRKPVEAAISGSQLQALS